MLTRFLVVVVLLGAVSCSPKAERGPAGTEGPSEKAIKDEEEAVKALKPASPSFTHDEAIPGRPVIAVTLGGRSARKWSGFLYDSDFEQLAKFKSLQRLALPRDVTGHELKKLAPATNLR